MTRTPTITGTVRFALLTLWAFICLFPIYWVAITSFKSNNAIADHPTYLPFIDFTPQLDAWRFILLDYNENLMARYANSAVIGVCSTFLAVTAATLLLYGVLPVALLMYLMGSPARRKAAARRDAAAIDEDARSHAATSTQADAVAPVREEK